MFIAFTHLIFIQSFYDFCFGSKINLSKNQIKFYVSNMVFKMFVFFLGILENCSLFLGVKMKQMYQARFDKRFV